MENTTEQGGLLMAAQEAAELRTLTAQSLRALPLEEVAELLHMYAGSVDADGQRDLAYAFLGACCQHVRNEIGEAFFDPSGEGA